MAWMWTKIEDGKDDRGRKVTRYQSETGWLVIQSKRHNGPGGSPRYDHNPSRIPVISYDVVDATGRKRNDGGSTVASAKEAAEVRARYDELRADKIARGDCVCWADDDGRGDHQDYCPKAVPR